jgi:hypothetical protein
MRLRSGLLATCAWLTLLGSVRADSLSVGFSNGTLNTTPSIVTYKTKGTDMAGMAFTFTFTDGSTATSFWASGSNSLGLSNGVTVSVTGDTFFHQWTMTNNNGSNLGVTKMVIDAGLGNSVFDQTFHNLDGTPGSASGKTFKPTNTGTGLVMTAMYSDIVRVGAAAPVGDLFRTLTVNFNNKGGFATGTSMKFWMDTDTVKPLTTPQSIRTPAPPALLLALFGVPVVVWRRPRKT